MKTKVGFVTVQYDTSEQDSARVLPAMSLFFGSIGQFVVVDTRLRSSLIKYQDTGLEQQFALTANGFP